MLIKSLNITSFGTLYNSIGLDNFLASGKNSPEFKKELSTARSIIRENGLHKKKNVDLILNYNDSDGFYTVISSKKQGVPMNPNYRHPVRQTRELIQSLTNWVSSWDYAYSSEAIKEQKQFNRSMRKLRELLK